MSTTVELAQGWVVAMRREVLLFFLPGRRARMWGRFERTLAVDDVRCPLSQVPLDLGPRKGFK